MQRMEESSSFTRISSQLIIEDGFVAFAAVIMKGWSLKTASQIHLVSYGKGSGPKAPDDLVNDVVKALEA